VNVLYQCNDKYAPYCGVSITSLFENNKDVEEIHVYLLDDNISDLNKYKLLECAQKYNRTIEFVDTTEIITFLKNNNVPQYRNSYTIWLKVFCVSLLGLTDGNLIYIDADTIVKSIKELDTLDMGDNCCGMVEAFEAFDYKRLTKMNVPKYYYAGMIVFDVKNYINQECEKKIIEHVTKNCRNYPFPEQDTLCVLFSDKIYTIDPKYDYAYVYEETMGIDNAKKIFKWPQYFYEDVKTASKDVRVCHCLSMYGKRPWHEGCQESKHAQWDYYLSISLWKDYKKEKIKVPVSNSFQKTLFQILPGFLYNPIHRFFYYRLIKKNADSWKETIN